MGGFISIIGITDGLLVKYLKSAQITCQMIYHNNFIILLVKNYDKMTKDFVCIIWCNDQEVEVQGGSFEIN